MPSKVYCIHQVFNHLVTQFTFTLRNFPESTINDHIDTQVCIKNLFRMFDAAILFIEMKLSVEIDVKRLKAIAQVIAECDGKPHASQACTFCS